MFNNKNKMNEAQTRYKKVMQRLEDQNVAAARNMDMLGALELTILKDFDQFSNLIEQIQQRPDFAEVRLQGVSLPQYDAVEIQNVSVGASVALGVIGGAAVGTAGGFAAAGATTWAVTAFATASTGTAISSLSGAALSNAVLAWLGGGSIAAGGGGVAAGSMVLGVTTGGVAFVVGSALFLLSQYSLSKKVEEAVAQVAKIDAQATKIAAYLWDLKTTALIYMKSLKTLQSIYQQHLDQLSYLIVTQQKTNWTDFTPQEKKLVENTVMLVSVLFKMAQLPLVEQNDEDTDVKKINKTAIQEQLNLAENAVAVIK